MGFGARIDAGHGAIASLPQGVGRIVEIADDLRLGVESPVRQDQNQLGVGRERMWLVHDDRAIKAAAKLLAGMKLDQRLIEIESGVGRGEFDVPCFAGRHKFLHKSRRAVYFIGDSHSAPMKRHRLFKPVDQSRLDFLPKIYAQQGAGALAAKAPDFCRRRGRRQDLRRARPRFEQDEPVLLFGPRRAGRAREGSGRRSRSACGG